MRSSAPIPPSPVSSTPDEGQVGARTTLSAHRISGHGLVVAVVALVVSGLVAMGWSGAQRQTVRHGLGILPAVVLGAVEGITEYLPISSTAHLVVTARLLGLDDSSTGQQVLDSYLVLVQGGAILAVAWLFRRRLVAMARAARPGGDPGPRRVLGAVLISSLPAGLLGLAAGDVIKGRLFEPAPIALAWLVGGIVLVLVARPLQARSGGSLEDIRWPGALLVGLAQCLALWPGTSRSLVTILAGCLTGLGLGAAVELSFLVGFVTLLGATGFEVLRHGSATVALFGWTRPLVGMVVAFGSATLAIRWLVSSLSEQSMAGFGWYRIVAALAALAWFAWT